MQDDGRMAGVLGQRFSGDARANSFQPLSYPRDGPKGFDREARSLEGLAEVETSWKQLSRSGLAIRHPRLPTGSETPVKAWRG